MPRIALTGGAYTAASVVASAQRSLNLYAEPLPGAQGEPAQMAHYPTPGMWLWATMPEGPIRGIWQAVGNGQTFVVAGNGVYTILPPVRIGQITPGLKTPVSMCDNGLNLLIVDGSKNGWTVDLGTNTLSQINDPNEMFVGADRVDYLDTYFLLNKKGTPQFYISGSLALTWDTLDFANKESFSDHLVTLAIAKRELWLFGDRTTEVWYNAGATDTGAGSFPFAEIQSVFVDHGCAAKYSVATYDNSVFWLTRDRQGQGIVMRGAGYQTTRISTFAIEAEFATYVRIDDAIGFTYQMAGHTFYVLSFPHADKTWVCDLTTNLWHEWCWIDTNGTEFRHRANCFCNVYGSPVVGDWENGNLYILDRATYTDNGRPIKRLRSYPHILADGKRVFYRQFQADFETGWAPEFINRKPETPIRCSFDAADDTDFATYQGEAGGAWTGSGGIILSDAFTGGTGVTSASYQCATEPEIADYAVRFSVVPPNYDEVLTDNALWAMGRASDASHGYRVTVRTDGSQYYVALSGVAAPPAELAMGTLSSGRYAVALTMRGNFISVQVQRTVDAKWLSWAGAWVVDPNTLAFAVADETYTAAGNVLIGGNWPAPP